MRRLSALLLLSSALLALSASAAFANPAPDFAPAPAWVKRVPLTLPTTATDAPTRIILLDHQTDLAKGSIARFSEVAAKVQTTAGLSAGNVVLSWRPDVDTMTVNALTVLRNGKRIDVLATQKFTVIRRESNLEQATLDGRLTASLLIDGMEIGDVVNLATTIVTRDPTMNGHVETVTGQWNGVAIDHAHARLRWDKDIALRLQSSPGLPTAPTIDDARGHSLEIAADNVQPLIPPKSAPARFQLGRLLEATNYRSWADISALMAPLYAKAETIDPKGPLAAQIAQIRAAHADPVARANAALDLAQSRIRYVALQMGAGGYVPATADATWASRFGDCKAKTAVLLAMLHRLDIVAVPVLVSASGGDAVGAQLPMVALFDHVLVRATIKGRDYWLDGTRLGDTDIARLTTPDFGYGLPLVPAAALVRIIPAPRTDPQIEYALAIDAREGVFASAKAHVDVTYRGDGAQGLKLALAAMPGATRDTAIREFFRSTYDFIEPDTVIAAFDPATGNEKLSMDGSAKLKWNDNWLRIPGSSIAFNADFARPAGPDRDAPFDTSYPSFERRVATIKLPPGITLWPGHVGHDVNQTLAGVEYHREATLSGNVLHMMASERTVVPEVAATVARAAQARLRSLNDEDVHLDNSSYGGTPADLAALKASTPDTADAYRRRGRMLLNHGEPQLAAADFDAARDLEPNDIATLAERAIAYATSGQIAKAEADLVKVDAALPNNAVALRAHGVLAMARNDLQAAVDAFTASLKVDPDNGFALSNRAEANRRLSHYDAALTDTATLLRIAPDNLEVRLLRINILVGQNKKPLALVEADSIQRTMPGNAYAQAVAAKTYAGLGQKDRARAIMDAAIARAPDALLFINRAEIRDRKDVAGRRADLDAALALDPHDENALAAKAQLQLDQGDYRGAITQHSAILTDHPDYLRLLIDRGIAFAKAGDAKLAEQDFAAYRARDESASGANALCWRKATNNVSLESALADCTRGLKASPTSAATLDSRGFTYLRLGRFDEAIADLDAALKLRPQMANSLYTRSLAWAGKGDTAKAQSDRTAALALSPDLVDEYAGYGIDRAPTVGKQH